MSPLIFRKQVFKIKARDKLNDQEVSDRFGISTPTLLPWKKNLSPTLKRNKPATK